MQAEVEVGLQELNPSHLPPPFALSFCELLA